MRQTTGRVGLGDAAEFLLDVKRHSLEMARGCGLASSNAHRRRYGLKPYDSFEPLTGEREIAARLRALYGGVDELERFVALFAESYGARDMMGELLTVMVANDAFTQALTNPLLAEAAYGPQTFSAEGLRIIESAETLADVIARNAGVGDPGAVGFVARG